MTRTGKTPTEGRQPLGGARAEPPRPRRVSRQREAGEAPRRETRRRLLAAARAEFAERGYAAATVIRIAERADVSVQTLYSNWGNKRNLLRAVMEGALTGDDDVPLEAAGQPLAVLTATLDPGDAKDPCPLLAHLVHQYPPRARRAGGGPRSRWGGGPCRPPPAIPATPRPPAGCWPPSSTSTGCSPSGRRSAGRPTGTARPSTRTSPRTGSSSPTGAGRVSTPCSPGCPPRRYGPGSATPLPPTRPGSSPAPTPTTCWSAGRPTAMTSWRTGSAPPSPRPFSPTASSAAS